MYLLTQWLVFFLLPLQHQAQNPYHPLPDVPYTGRLMSKKLENSTRSNLILRTFVEPLSKRKSNFAFIIVAEDKSKKTFNSSSTSVVGYFPFNDIDFVSHFYKKSTVMSYFNRRLEPLKKTMSQNATILQYLEEKYLKRSRKLFRLNLEKTANSSNRREALGNQIYATYPGTRHCQAARQAHYNSEKAPLKHLEKCCVERTQCSLQSNAFFRKRPTPLAADGFRRVSCECDDRFARCLHSLKSPDADYVGDLFFNVLQLQCMVTSCNGHEILPKHGCQGDWRISWKSNVTPYKYNPLASF